MAQTEEKDAMVESEAAKEELAQECAEEKAEEAEATEEEGDEDPQSDGIPIRLSVSRSGGTLQEAQNEDTWLERFQSRRCPVRALPCTALARSEDLRRSA